MVQLCRTLWIICRQVNIMVNFFSTVSIDQRMNSNTGGDVGQFCQAGPLELQLELGIVFRVSG